MSRVELLSNISSLFEYKTISSFEGDEFVLLRSSTIESIDSPIDDKTAFEALENHVHIIDCIRKSEIPELVRVSKIFGMSILNHLKTDYPEKDFYVFISLKQGDSLIIRFHQKWLNEKPYYDARDFLNSNELVLMFES